MVLINKQGSRFANSRITAHLQSQIMPNPAVLLVSFFAAGLAPSDRAEVVSAFESYGHVSVMVQQSDQAPAQEKRQVLVTPEWLEKNASNPKVVLIGLGQTKKQYLLAHLPNERFVDWRTEITDPKHPDRFNVPPQASVQELMRDLGVENDSTIVLSDNLSSRLSTRMFWTLRVYGHKDIRILDGGRKGWVQSGRDFTRELPKIKPSKYVTRSLDQKCYANLANVREGLKKEAFLIDGRPATQFTGETAGKAYHNGKEHKRKGHIVSARNIVWKDNFDAKGRFKSKEELMKMYRTAGATQEKKVITYCNEGLHAAPPWFVLTEILGYPDVQLYDDSMSEWANRDDTPMEKSGVKK